jgi:hypothetical protein
MSQAAENGGEYVAACLTSLYTGPYLMNFLNVGVPCIFSFAAAHPCTMPLGAEFAILQALAHGHDPYPVAQQHAADAITTRFFIDFVRELIERFGGKAEF